MAVTLLCCAWTSHCSVFSCYGAQVLSVWASVLAAHGLQSSGSVVVGVDLVTPRHVESSHTRDQTCVRWQADSYPLYCQGNLIVYKNKLADFRVFFCLFVFYFPAAAVAKARKEYRENQWKKINFCCESDKQEMLGRERSGSWPFVET